MSAKDVKKELTMQHVMIESAHYYYRLGIIDAAERNRTVNDCLIRIRHLKNQLSRLSQAV